MNTIIKAALTAAMRRCAYLGALFQLRTLETNLAGMCEALPSITDAKTRADTAAAIKALSLEVVAARNRTKALRPIKRAHPIWKAA